MGYVFSKTELRLFHIFSTFRDVNWEDRTRRPAENWRMATIALKDRDSITEALGRIAEEFDSYVLSPIEAQYAAGAVGEPDGADEGADSECEQGNVSSGNSA